MYTDIHSGFGVVEHPDKEMLKRINARNKVYSKQVERILKAIENMEFNEAYDWLKKEEISLKKQKIGLRNKLDFTKRGDENIFFAAEETLHQVISFVAYKIEEYKEVIDDSEPTEKVNTIHHQKLKWDGNKNVLIDILKQLKEMVNKDKTPLLNNTYAEIANFLVQSVEGFENNNPLHLTQEIARADKPIKSNNKIVVECK